MQRRPKSLRRCLPSAAAGPLGLAFLATAAIGADLPPAPLYAPRQPSAWQFQATGYGWATAIDGQAGVRNLPPVNVDVSFADILKDLNGALMGSFLAKKGEWLIMTDLVWAALSDDAVVRLPGVRHPALATLSPGTRVDFKMRQLIASAAIGYRLPLGGPDLDIYATAGLRYQRMTVEIDALPGLIPITLSRKGTEQWADPTVGFSAQWRINERWFVNVLADVGGFGVGSRLTTQGFASVGYRWTESISTALGYRAIYTDYRNGGFTYRATQHGVFSSIAYHF
ncbi:hypothetical protein [Bosea sp. Root381]|uniref:hypothetical protein n=1 Tax=Bosea sp. Root381 TaxID=1736524 RepID=UPI0009EB171A|nr:hypothetical protein [Bosea sp. Root381]